MVELDDLDLNLDLDDDFPTGPLNKISSFGTSFSSLLPWNEEKTKENPSSSKSISINEDSFKVSPVAKNSDLEEKNDKQTDSLLRNTSEVDLKSKCGFTAASNNSKPAFIFHENEHNTSKDSTYLKRILSHRKFPGPAGLLPDRPLKDLTDVNIIVDESIENVAPERQESIILCSQSASIFSESSYKKLISDFDMLKEDCPLNKYTITWVKKKALQKSLNGKKIPFLAVVLHHLDHSTPDPVLKLMDQTGEIYGILHRDVWSDLGGKLHPGAALALREVGVLITGITRRQIYLNITINNILNIYSYSDEEDLETSCINEVDKNELLKDVKFCHAATMVLKKNSPPQPFSIVGNQKLNSPSSSCVKGSKCGSSKIFENKNAAFSNKSCTGNFLPGNNFDMLPADDISYFMATIDEDDFTGESSISSQTKGSDSNKLVTSKKFETNRKRKMERNVANSSKKSECKYFENIFESNYSVLPAKLGRMKSQERLITGSQPVSQEEAQIVSQVLEGIDFDDFDDFES